MLLDDLEQLPAGAGRWLEYDALVADPGAEIARLCRAMDLEWDDANVAALALSNYTVSPPERDKWRRLGVRIEAVLPRSRSGPEGGSRGGTDSMIGRARRRA